MTDPSSDIEKTGPDTFTPSQGPKMNVPPKLRKAVPRKEDGKKK